MRDRSRGQGTESLVLTVPPPLTEQPASVYLSGLGPGSRRPMRQALDVMAGILTSGSAQALTLDWTALRYKHTAALRAALIEKYAPATVNRFLGGLRQVLKQALLLELMDPQDYARAIAVKSVKFTTELRGRCLSREEITALLEVCALDSNRLLGARDAALVAILRGAGLRRQEAVNLDLRDLDRSTGTLKVRRGKGGKDRTVYLPDVAMQLVLAWICVRGSVVGPLLNHIRKGGQVVNRRLTAQSVLLVLRKRALDAGVAPFSPHDFRRTFASDLLDAGVDIVTVQKLMGHSSPDQTAKYDRRGEEAKKKAVNLLSF